MEQRRSEGCEQVLAEVKALRDEVAAFRGWLAQEPAKKRFTWRRWLRRLLVAYAIVMLYLLGVGTAGLLVRRTHQAEGIVGLLCAPVDWLYVAFPSTQRPLDAYITLWCPEGADEVPQ